jgi:hypothetical protein
VASFGEVEKTGEPAQSAWWEALFQAASSTASLRWILILRPCNHSDGQQTNMLVSVDQASIWSYEKYPSGYEVWEQWGYWDPGDYNAWLYADAVGWHLVAIYGETSGWSNAVWIYVEPGSPDVANGGPQPVLSETEEEETEAPDVGEIQP